MIPRVRVNYGLADLLRAACADESKSHWRDRLIEALARYFDVATDQIVLTPSGRAGLYILLNALDRPKALIPAYTCKAVVEAASLAERDIVYGRSCSGAYDYNMSPTAAEEQADEETVVVATHQYGIPCQIEGTVEATRRRGGVVIEDAAASLGTRVGGRLTGTFGAAGFFSFDSTKLINVPLKGGFILLNDRALIDPVREAAAAALTPMQSSVKRRLLVQGLLYTVLKNPWVYKLFHTVYFEVPGRMHTETPEIPSDLSEFYRYELSEWQARIALDQIVRIDEIIAARRAIYSAYSEAAKASDSLIAPPPDTNQEWACVRFPIQTPNRREAAYRSGVAHGVDHGFSFPLLGAPQSEAEAWSIAESILNPPFYPQLSSRERLKVERFLAHLSQE